MITGTSSGKPMGATPPAGYPVEASTSFRRREPHRHEAGCGGKLLSIDSRGTTRDGNDEMMLWTDEHEGLDNLIGRHAERRCCRFNGGHALGSWQYFRIELVHGDEGSDSIER